MAKHLQILRILDFLARRLLPLPLTRLAAAGAAATGGNGQLYRGGTLWFEALHRERTEFKIIVTGKLAQPDGSYTRVRREFTTPGRIWNKDHVMTF